MHNNNLLLLLLTAVFILSTAVASIHAQDDNSTNVTTTTTQFNCSSNNSSSSNSKNNCTSPPGAQEDEEDIATDLSKAAAAFLSMAVVSASAMSGVAFGLSRSQEVGEFVTATGKHLCVASNFTEVPIFSDSPLALQLPSDWCGYSGGAVVGNLILSGIACGGSLLFGVVGCLVRRRRVSLYRIMDKGYFGLAAAFSIGLFLTPIIQHGGLCALRARWTEGSGAARIIFGLVSLVLFFLVPIWSYRPLKRHFVWAHGVLKRKSAKEEEEEDQAPSCCRSTLGGAWSWVFSAKKWKFVPRSELSEEAREMISLHRGSTGGFQNDKEQERMFNAWKPLFEEYDLRCPYFFHYEVSTNALLGLPSLFAEAFIDDASGAACFAWGVPLFLFLFSYWLFLVYKRPIQVRFVFIATVVVAGLQCLLTLLGFAAVTSTSAPSWAASIDVALVIAQALLSLCGITIAVKGAIGGGWKRMRGCCCPRKDDEEDQKEGGDEDEDADAGDDNGGNGSGSNTNAAVELELAEGILDNVRATPMRGGAAAKKSSDANKKPVPVKNDDDDDLILDLSDDDALPSPAHSGEVEL